MKLHTSRVVTVCTAALCTFAYACALSEETSTGEQASENLNGSNLNGSNLNGSNLNGMTLLGFLVSEATHTGVALTDLRVENGQLAAERNAITLRGPDLDGAVLQASARDINANPVTSATVTYRITDVVAEDSAYDPTGTESTFLYEIEQWNGSTWVPGCPLDHNGQRFAIPVAAEWDESGTRSDSSTMFTLACTAGVIAKCYRWGYRPWVTGYGDLAAMHYACTRLARADWCGDGVSHTTTGTWINVWDILPSPGPIQHQETVEGMEFDSGWNGSGATCLSTARWAASGSVIAAACPGKLPAPGQGGTACNSQAAALSHDASTLLFKEMDIP